MGAPRARRNTRVTEAHCLCFHSRTLFLIICPSHSWGRHRFFLFLSGSHSLHLAPHDPQFIICNPVSPHPSELGISSLCHRPLLGEQWLSPSLLPCCKPLDFYFVPQKAYVPCPCNPSLMEGTGTVSFFQVGVDSTHCLQPAAPT